MRTVSRHPAVRWAGGHVPEDHAAAARRAAVLAAGLAVPARPGVAAPVAERVAPAVPDAAALVVPAAPDAAAPVAAHAGLAQPDAAAPAAANAAPAPRAVAHVARCRLRAALAAEHATIHLPRSARGLVLPATPRSPIAVPLYVLRVPVRYYRRPPPYFHGWVASAPPRWDQHWGPSWEERRHGWDRWDRSSPPPVAGRWPPLRGDRSPRLRRRPRCSLPCRASANVEPARRIPIGGFPTA